MSDFLLGYEKISPTTWVYLSSLLMIGLYFKFNRAWSMRNFDLLLLILLAPGLLLAEYGRETYSQAIPYLQQDREQQQKDNPEGDEPVQFSKAAQPYVEQYRRGWNYEFFGYIWLFCVGPFLVIRLLIDTMMVRRPLLQPNLSTGGLTFLGISVFLFLMANVLSSTPSEADLSVAKDAYHLIERDASEERDLNRRGPGFALFHVLPVLPTNAFVEMSSPEQDDSQIQQMIVFSVVTKITTIAAHLAIVVGIILIGYFHFNNLQTGIGVATLYLLLPYTAQMTGHVEHVLPAAMLTWAVFFYRRPFVSGIFLGLSIGMVYYPMFLLPLWISFYWRRGMWRFVGGIVLMLIVSVASLAFVSEDFAAYLQNLQAMFGLWAPKLEGLQGVWGPGRWSPYYRIPVLTAFVAMCFTFAVWPAQKNLGTLVSCTGAVMAATQFWHGFGGGLLMAWYLPLFLLVIFRPNLEDRVAQSVLGEGWFGNRKTVGRLNRAA